MIRPRFGLLTNKYAIIYTTFSMLTMSKNTNVVKHEIKHVNFKNFYYIYMNQTAIHFFFVITNPEYYVIMLKKILISPKLIIQYKWVCTGEYFTQTRYILPKCYKYCVSSKIRKCYCVYWSYLPSEIKIGNDNFIIT